MTFTTTYAPQPRRWWFTPKDGGGVRYEVEVVSWQEHGAIVIPDFPDWDGKPIYARLSELTSEPA